MVAAPWLYPVAPELLLVALCGAVYLLLALGLLGTSRFSLFLGVGIPLWRAWFRMWPLPEPGWELLRTVLDIALMLLCGVLAWGALRLYFSNDAEPPPSEAGEPGA